MLTGYLHIISFIIVFLMMTIIIIVAFKKYFKFLDKRKLNLYFKIKFLGVMLIEFTINSF